MSRVGGKILSVGVGSGDSVFTKGEQMSVADYEREEAKQKQEKYRTLLEYDSIREAPKDRKPFVRREASDCDVGLDIGGNNDKSSLRVKKLASQAAYRQMLADEKARAPIEATYTAIRKPSPKWENTDDTKGHFSIGGGPSNLNKTQLERNSREYHAQVATDIHLREQRRLNEKNDKVYTGLIIGKEEIKKHAKKSVKRVENCGYSNVFPSANDGYDESAEKLRKKQQNDLILAQTTKNAAVAPKAKRGSEEDTYVNYSGLTGLAIGFEGSKEERNEMKLLKQQEYMRQLGDDVALKENVRAEIALKQRTLGLGNPRKNNIV